MHWIVFDYGEGFSPRTLPSEFVDATSPVELHAGRDGVNINPLQVFPSDLHGPVNVAQRVADTFARVYKKIGVQQHAIIRQAVLEAPLGGGEAGAALVGRGRRGGAVLPGADAGFP